MVDPKGPRQVQFERLMALHRYFLNADFMRDTFMRRVKRRQSPDEVDFAAGMDDSIALSLWYATLYVAIEGWRAVGLIDPELAPLLADDRTDELRRFRNQVFHYKREYDNPRVLGFLGWSDSDAHTATEWVRRTHRTLGRTIEKAIEDLIGSKGTDSPEQIEMPLRTQANTPVCRARQRSLMQPSGRFLSGRRSCSMSEGVSKA